MRSRTVRHIALHFEPVRHFNEGLSEVARRPALHVSSYGIASEFEHQQTGLRFLAGWGAVDEGEPLRRPIKRRFVYEYAAAKRDSRASRVRRQIQIGNRVVAGVAHVLGDQRAAPFARFQVAQNSFDLGIG